MRVPGGQIAMTDFEGMKVVQAPAHSSESVQRVKQLLKFREFFGTLNQVAERGIAKL